MMLISNFIELFMEAAPWLLMGLVIAGLIKVYIPQSVMNKQLGGHGIGTVIKAALIGAPLPLCSCGVIPTALGLRRAGASKGATTAFLVATPETGVDSIGISYGLLGPFMAVIRPIGAFISAVSAGIMVNLFDDETKATKSVVAAVKVADGNGCHDTQLETPLCQETKMSITATSTTQTASKTNCCASTGDSAVKTTTIAVAKWRQVMRFSFFDMVEDTALWLMIGLFFAALVETYVPSNWLTEWGDTIWAMLIIIVVSIPMYVCATASTPIAAGLLLAGVSPGAILVFMLAGPATNMALLLVIAREMGKRTVAAYLVGVIIPALLLGFLTNYLVAEMGVSVVAASGGSHELLPTWLVVSTSTVVLITMLNVFYQQLFVGKNK